jgi:hypothetical protein
MKRIIARWESRGGKHWVELYADEHGYGYDGNGCGGDFHPRTKLCIFGSIPASSDSHARALMQAKVDSGYFLPDDAKTPMRSCNVKPPMREVRL